MNELTEISYAFIMCFKRSQGDNVALLRNLMKAQSEWSGSPIEYISLSDVAYMMTSVIGQLGLLSTERGMHKWYDCLRTDALFENISEYDNTSIVIKELEIAEAHQRMARFYINYIFSFSSIVRLLMVDHVPGLREYYETNKDKWN